ncbi:MAG: tRNA (5-methylaminomethyl-2-thiouridine)(34)-methyltransferase MnmD [Bacteroides sp.]|nr:tRNA (5-methylaminomethyl-2-thiouridine)(34)-methyltransferase MnmD [Bacteroides sp.]
MVLTRTDDGSNTLYLPEMDEHYHSTKGAITESQHVFIEMGLHRFPGRSPRILEVGFGTGLNAFLTLLEAEKRYDSVHYTTLERYPLPAEVIRQLEYSSVERGDQELYDRLHQAEWNQDIAITPRFTLCKREVDFQAFSFSGKYDVVYFDAFAPEKQPEMWRQELFNKLYTHLNKGGVFTTYCAKGVIRRILQSAGFTVERLPGPPGGKREILRALKIL